MRTPLLPVRLPAGAAADVRVIDACLCQLGAVLSQLAATPVVRLLRAPMPAPAVGAADQTNLGTVYADLVLVIAGDGAARVLADPQAPTRTRPGVVRSGIIAASAWLPGTEHSTEPTVENLAALREAVNGMIEMLTETQHLGVGDG